MKNTELIALQTVKDEYCKLREKYRKKAVKEREKVKDVYVTVCGEKCYTIAVVSCLLSIIGAFISREGFESGQCSIGWVSFFEILFAADIIIFISVLFGLDSIVSDFLERKLCKDEYDLEDYIGIKRAVESCFENRSNEFCVVNKKHHLLVYYRAQGKHGCQIVINLGRGVFVNNNLQDDVILIKGYMSFNSRHYIMEIQMNEYTKYCLEQ